MVYGRGSMEPRKYIITDPSQWEILKQHLHAKGYMWRGNRSLLRTHSIFEEKVKRASQAYPVWIILSGRNVQWSDNRNNGEPVSAVLSVLDEMQGEWAEQHAKAVAARGARIKKRSDVSDSNDAFKAKRRTITDPAQMAQFLLKTPSLTSFK